MLHDVWFWLFVASYIGGGLCLLVWITDGGTYHRGVARWRMALVFFVWPVAMITGMGQRFFDWFIVSPHSD